MGQEYKTHLLEILYVRSFQHDPEGKFQLSSGKTSDVYIDAKKTMMSSEGMELVGFTFFQELKMAPVDGIGGLTLGADPIAYATALVSTQQGKGLDAFVVRKEAKRHGTMRWIEGNLRPGADVAIVDDVTTTGASTITAIERAREEGLNVRRVIALVDREEGARENIMAKTGLKLDAIFTKTDLLELHKKTKEAEEAEKRKGERASAKKRPAGDLPDF
ncbi:MAG: orotate phosphoribosyltransferase [Deltaproteobacteria bacterium]|nr:orotate phosphoribosyltransferase [Deltaproteobacteria bacterium]